MKIPNTIRCVKNCADDQAADELRRFAAMASHLWTLMLNSRPPLGGETDYTHAMNELRELGNFIAKEVGQ